MAPSATIAATSGTTGIAAPGRQSYSIALIPGDGIGIEVIQAGKIVLEQLAKCLDTFDLSFEEFEWSSEYYKKYGKYLPDDALDQVRKFNAILFGAVGAPGRYFFALYLPPA
jgi:isocitrate/isopropylmalate dehydrogenase